VVIFGSVGILHTADFAKHAPFWFGGNCSQVCTFWFYVQVWTNAGKGFILEGQRTRGPEVLIIIQNLRTGSDAAECPVFSGPRALWPSKVNSYGVNTSAGGRGRSANRRSRKETYHRLT